MRISSWARRFLVATVAAGTLAAGGLSTSSTALAATYERGPAPTAQSIVADGPFSYATVAVPTQSSFGGGTIYYPTDTNQGTFGAVAVIPGFVGSLDNVAWIGSRLASHGFVVFTVATTNPFAFPGDRAAQLQAALTYLTQSSSVRDRVDPNRLAVAGHSMGGGGALEAVRNNPALKAAVALQPWDFGQNFSAIAVPSMIVGAQNDQVATVTSHSEPFYDQIPAGAEKAYLELAGAGHDAGQSVSNATQAGSMLSWLKRYVDEDTRYEQFLCPAPSGPSVAEYRDTCPA
ncbi:dienelactone hydrolase family protein [Yinghuangia sp. ASG 101]|uniref:alpha/beta hydrolase family protein n=1 Tax=Yinghuangia sp. ASG 101 TaxID=2896848 RepID=UPI001E4A3D17|nr:PHB depolymerase family esterase [Yinghuangia sp. ASG 101]UGQ10993.1 dienelactone hydrolase family protein [Yinghuangia sp. ASG 101]